MDHDKKLDLGDAEADEVHEAGMRSGEGLATGATPKSDSVPPDTTVHVAGIRSGAELEDDD